MCRSAFRRDKQGMIMLSARPSHTILPAAASISVIEIQDRSRLKPLLQGYILSLDFPWVSPVYLIGSQED